ncbi:rRNA maturation RNase YbeY [Cochlodiniinecator piscidefendens]|uniref:rRNA maturation RNase YbeY n=1 Tax=Cochlodiniinecator piscidefendens TaxID=2715756 RepID=UPI00140D32A6|nr:rRNA maturation RNase YbeY [Cochlodiniinecator piscidefendens]
MLTDVVIEDERWADVLEAVSEPAAGAVLNRLSIDIAAFEICIMGCDDARIAELNTEFREKPTPTNVLSWPSEERGVDFAGGIPELPVPDPTGMAEELGDIAISFDTCKREADAENKPFDAHVTHLIVHGVLHLLGYDHIYDEDAALMEGLEVEILAQLGLPNPY